VLIPGEKVLIRRRGPREFGPWLVVLSGLEVPRSLGDPDKGWRVHDAGGGNWMSGVVATEKYLYADYMLGPNLLRSPINDGTKWETYCDIPGAMGNGSNDYGLAAATDGQRWYIVSGNFTSGLWRYIEE
jgi:hypothetical protein